MASLIKLVSGEELIGDVVKKLNDNENTTTIKNPVIIVQLDAKSLGFRNYIPYVNDQNGYTINNHAIAFIMPIVDKMEDEYNKFTNKVIVPKAELKLVGDM